MMKSRPPTIEQSETSSKLTAERTYHEQPDSTDYFLITKNLNVNNAEGMASQNGNGAFGLNFGAFLLTDELSSKPYYAHTLAHEVGHLLGTGRLDDKTYQQAAPLYNQGEVYSGGNDKDREDKTPEKVSLRLETSDTSSVMSEGWNEEVNDDPMGGDYIALSIEEILELEFDNINSKND